MQNFCKLHTDALADSGMTHFLEPSSEACVSRKDFGLRVVPATEGTQVRILVPKTIQEALHRLSIDTAEQLMSVLYCGYSSIARELQWDLQKIPAVRQNLSEKLRGVLEEHYLRPNEPLPVSYGAFGPYAPEARE